MRVDVVLSFAAGVSDAGANDAVTPAGRPVALSVTAELKLFTLAIEIVLVPLPPWAIVSAVGEAAMVKLGGGLTVSLMAVVAAKLPEVPVMVTVAVPVVAEALAANVSTLLPVAGFVPNVAVTPLGSPEAARVTPSANPFTGVTVMVVVPLPPWIRFKLAGESESVKPGILPAVPCVRVSANTMV